ncbi:peptide chain release factor H [Pseudoalteromonas sp. MSK9-3]|uniref:peptide chain release factor H n=1 Tax=Pseudoalteromonas sp. MSK9-3 TaxID=1897633 RepID=UPI000E6BA35A|nr:peptide chain release factor H [Pseudoalteromonas sp. MSK9-3]RJE77705.1 peptide chain release factor H [Pseudoalteromonas sp. MSK9-3]
MILLQLSAGQGPLECCQAVGLALKVIEKQCCAQGVKLTVIEAKELKERGCFKSVLLQLDSAQRLAKSWQGIMLWVCQSKYRPKHKRKNWFFSGQMYEVNEAQLDRGVTFQTCRASGAGGQHVNTTDSAVRATHHTTGLSVRVESERSQHANKRLASILLFQKLEALKHEHMTQQEKVRWQQHQTLERGNPIKVFKGEKFSHSHGS